MTKRREANVTEQRDAEASACRQLVVLGASSGCRPWAAVCLACWTYTSVVWHVTIILWVHTLVMTLVVALLVVQGREGRAVMQTYMLASYLGAGNPLHTCSVHHLIHLLLGCPAQHDPASTNPPSFGRIGSCPPVL